MIPIALAAAAGCAYVVVASAAILWSEQASRFAFDVPGGVGLGAAYTDWMRIVVPLPLYAATAAFGSIVALMHGGMTSRLVARVAVVGLVAHLNLVLIQMSTVELTALATFHAIYVRAVTALLTCACFVIPYAIARLWTDRPVVLLIPLYAMPLAQLILRPDRVVVAALGILALIGILVSTRVSIKVSRRSAIGVGGGLLAIFAAALTARATYGLSLGRLGVDTLLANAPDAGYYYANASKLVDGMTISGQFSPGYSGFLAALFWITRKDQIEVMLAHALMGALVPIAVFALARRVADATVAWVAAILASVSGLLIYNSANLTRESLGIVLFTTLALLVLWVPRPRLRVLSWAALGALWGVAVVVDPVFYVVMVVALLALGVRDRFNGASIAGIATAALVGLAIATLLDLRITGSATPLARDMATASHVAVDFNPYSMELAKIGIQPVRDPGAALSATITHPDLAIPLFAAKIGSDIRTFFFGGSPGLFDLVLLVKNSPFSAALLFYGYAAGIVGASLLILRARRDWPMRWPIATLMALVASYATTYIVVFFGMTRFRAALHPVLLILTAVGVVETARWVWRTSRVAAKDSSVTLPHGRSVSYPLSGEISPQS